MQYIKCIIVAASVILSACATNQPAVKVDPTIVTCFHKYDPRIIVSYRKDHITKFVVNGVTTFYILDVNEKDIFLNIYEIENYVCSNNEEIK